MVNEDNNKNSRTLCGMAGKNEERKNNTIIVDIRTFSGIADV
jgi:hypothetical protein